MRPLLILACASAAFGANWTDRAEYDLALRVRSELLPQKRLALLEEWKAKYPKSEQQLARTELYFAAYQGMNDNTRVVDAAAEILAVQPDHKSAAYWYTVLLPQGGSVQADRLALGEKTSRALASGPTEFVARRTLGWVLWQRGDLANAEAEIRKCLALEPKQAEMSAWLGTVLAQQPAKQVPALWYLARAAAYRGDGALPDPQRRQMRSVLERLYTGYHGEQAGLEELITSAAGSPEPPAGFAVESAAAAAIRKVDEALTRENPRLAEWFRMRRQLEGADGERYFGETVRTAPFARLKGTVIRGVPETKPSELVIGVLDPSTPEVVLKLPAEWAKAPAAGTVVEFEGTPDSYTKAPFQLTLTTVPAKISR